MVDIVLIAHNLRSCHNVGSLLRTAEGLGVKKVFLTGYTPYPASPNDVRMPHLLAKINRQIVKTSLGAETTQPWQQSDTIEDILNSLHLEGYTIAALEQAELSRPLPSYKASNKVALVVGREVEGLEENVLVKCDLILEIPMFGTKESFNVVQAAAMALYQCRFNNA